MALKRKLTKAEFDKLSDDLKKEYKADGENYFLDIDGDDADALRRSLDRERQTARDAKADLDKTKAELDELRKKLDDDDDADARKRGDIEKLEKSWQTKYDTLKADSDKRSTALSSRIVNAEKKAAIAAKAKEINAANADVIAELLAPRVRGELGSDDTVTLSIVDSDGNKVAGGLDDLAKSFKADARYKSLVGSGVGSGSAGQADKQKTPPGSAGGENDKTPNLGEMSSTQLAAHIRAKKESEEGAA